MLKSLPCDVQAPDAAPSELRSPSSPSLHALISVEAGTGPEIDADMPKEAWPQHATPAAETLLPTEHQLKPNVQQPFGEAKDTNTTQLRRRGAIARRNLSLPLAALDAAVAQD